MRPAMIPQTWLLSGIPRSGTSLCCRLAGELPDTVALSEPMRRDLFAGVDGHGEACRRIEEFVGAARARIHTEHRAPSVQVEGRLDDDRVGGPVAQDDDRAGGPVARDDDRAGGSVAQDDNRAGVPVVQVDDRAGVPFARGGLRQPRGGQGEIVVEKPLSDGFTLLIKHNALFAALLPALTDSFSCLALVRNPVAVLASWQTVNLPVHEGRIPAGEQFDAGLHARLEREPDVMRRQLRVLNWFFDRFLTHVEPENVLRYEDLAESGGNTLFRRLGRPVLRPAPLENRNTNRQYRHVEVDALLEALFDRGGAWSEYYGTGDCERVADMIRSPG